MPLRCRSALFAAVLALALGCAGLRDDGSPSEIAARLDDQEIATAELDAYIRDQLFAREAGTPSQLYELRREYLDALLEQRILERRAAESGLTPEETLAQAVAALGPVDDAEIDAFYEEHRDKVGEEVDPEHLETVRKMIRSFLERQRKATALEGLRAQSRIAVLLEAPRMAVEAVGPSRGPADARVTIIEFSDFQCPFCNRVRPTLDALLEAYPADVRLVYRHLPLANHPRARVAAEASVCADEQGGFWAFHDRIFDHPEALSDGDLLAHAKAIGLDPAAFLHCLDEDRVAATVERDFAAARDAGLDGTPSFLINGIPLGGAQPLERFRELVDEELAKLPKATPPSAPGAAAGPPPASPQQP